MSAFTNLLGDIAQYAGRGIEQGIQEQIGTEGDIRRQTRLFHAGKPLREAARAEEWAAGAPRRRMYGEMLGPILGAEGFVTPPTAERAEMEPGGLLTELDPDLARTMMNYLQVKRTAETAAQQREMTNLFRTLGLGMQREGLELRRRALEEKAPPAPTMERDLEAEAERLGILPEKRFEWKQKERARAAGQKAGAIQEEKPIPAATASQISQIDNMLSTIATEIRPQFNPDWVGPVAGPGGALRSRFNIGGILMGPQESRFRQAVLDISDQLLRARSGAQINEAEYQRMIKLVPNPNLAPANFLAALDRFEQAITKLREDKLRLATTPAKALRPGAATPAARPAPKRYASPDAVGAALKAGKITPEQARAILQADFGFSD